MRKETVGILLCVALVVILISTSMITMPNLDLPNHNSVKHNSVKSTSDEATTIIPTTTLHTATNPTLKQETTSPQVTEQTTTQITESKQETTVEENIVEETTVYNEPEQAESSGEYLIDISNPDYSYTPTAISISNGEREEIACIVMGEFGGGGFTGCALIAQCIRDAMVEKGYNGYNVGYSMQYYGYNSSPSEECYNAIDWVFSGNAAVQHRILVMNDSEGGWHSTQNFVIYYDGVWFYDMW